MADEVFGQYEVASWKVGNGPAIKFPLCSITEAGSNRIVQRDRPYRDGAKLDDVGRNSTKWTMVALFENSIQEPGLGSEALYPTVLNKLLDTFQVHATGDLIVPTRGLVRARAESYNRQEEKGQRDAARLTLVFCEDNEDNVDAQSFQKPSVNASAKRLTEQTYFDADSLGALTDFLRDLQRFGGELEALANAPGASLRTLKSQARIVGETANSIGRAATLGGATARNVHFSPRNSRVQRKLVQTEDLAGRSRAQSRGGRPAQTPYKVQAGGDIFAIAAQVGQSAKDLLDINPGVNARFIPPGTVISIFDEA